MPDTVYVLFYVLQINKNETSHQSMLRKGIVDHLRKLFHQYINQDGIKSHSTIPKIN